MDLVDTGFLIEVPDEKYPAQVELHPRKNRFGSKSHSWTLQLKEQEIADPRLEGLTSVYMAASERTEHETGDTRQNEIYALLVAEGELSNTAIRDHVGYKPDNYLKALQDKGRIDKDEGNRLNPWYALVPDEQEQL